MDWLTRHSDYDDGYWNYFVIPEGSEGKTAPHTTVRLKTTGYIAPDFDGTYKMCVPGNYFVEEVTADAAGIIATLVILNALSWKAICDGREICQNMPVTGRASGCTEGLYQHH